MKVLSFDPGYQNFAWVKTKYDTNIYNDIFAHEIEACNQLVHTITQVKSQKSVHKELRDFVAEVTDLMLDIDYIVVERFQSRGVKSGLTQECVTMMIGILLYHADIMNIPILLVTPSSWKNKLNGIVDLKMLYSMSWTTPHVLDAYLLGYYGICTHLNTIPFEGYGKDKNWCYYISCLEEKVDKDTLTKRKAVRPYYVRTSKEFI